MDYRFVFRAQLLTERLMADYYGYDALIHLGRDPRARALMPEVEQGERVPLGRIEGDERGEIIYLYSHYLAEAVAPGMKDEHARVWLAGALLTLGDALARSQYFDRTPALEMVRHLRNAVAHGNRFNIKHPAALERYPAYINTRKTDGSPSHQISPDLHGHLCLFEYMDAFDVLMVIQGAGRSLKTLATSLSLAAPRTGPDSGAEADTAG